MPNSESDLSLEGGVLKFNGEPKPDAWWVQGQPITSSQRYKKRDKYHCWKLSVACAVKETRKHRRCPAHRYAITLQFRFCERQHPDHEGDLDNYVKPVLDGLAAGLFLCNDKDPRELPRGKWTKAEGVDDSGFRTLLIRHLYVNSKEEEGVRIFVSSTGKGA